MIRDGFGSIPAEEKTFLGIELGSTRIKAVLTDVSHRILAKGSFEWENQLNNKVWSYRIDDIWKGIQEAFQRMALDARHKIGLETLNISAIGISAMMHGYMVFNEKRELLVPFRTWRNTMTEEAAEKLTKLFCYPIPQRWSIAHLYQSVIKQEKHVREVDYMITLSGYVHWMLTGKKVVGVGEAAGMFPVDPEKKDFDKKRIKLFEDLIREQKYAWKLEGILPKVLSAGQAAGNLTERGAKLLDPTGSLHAGIPFCPPEGDAGTGMVATNSVAPRKGNVSAGTSIFAMVVLERELEEVHSEIDIVATPEGEPVAMVHCNNFTSDLNAWISLFKELTKCLGLEVEETELYRTLYRKAMEGEPDGGGLLAYNYLSGEHITGLKEGRPLFVRSPGSRFNLANFMKVHLYTSLGALKTGLDILFKQGVLADELNGHGGFFQTEGVGQKIMSDAIDLPVRVMGTANEGGAWGIAVLAAYMQDKQEGESLAEYLTRKVFKGQSGTLAIPDKKEHEGFKQFMERYRDGLVVEKMAADILR